MHTLINCVCAQRACDGTLQVESSGGGGDGSAGSDEAASSMFQRFWDSAMALGPLDDETDTQSQMRFIIIIYNICAGPAGGETY
jgi:hypothetical protein